MSSLEYRANMHGPLRERQPQTGGEQLAVQAVGAASDAAGRVQVPFADLP